MSSMNGWKYQCHDGKETWESRLVELEFHQDYVTFTVNGRGSSLQAHIGIDNGVTWICFPVCEKACTLASYDNLFWNSEKLGIVLGSTADGITVSRALQEFNEYFEEYEK